MEKKISSVLGKLDTDVQKDKTRFLSLSYTKTNSQWIKDHWIKTMKLLEENIGKRVNPTLV
jgi:hypothetical protein